MHHRRRFARVLVRSGFLVMAILITAFSAASANRLEVWDWWGRATELSKAWFEHVEAEFKSRHPGVEIEYVHVSGTTALYDRLVAAAAAGVSPDVTQISVAFARGLHEAGLLLPLNDYIAKTPELQMDKFIPVAPIFNQKDGIIYGIPHNIDANALLYNVDAFEEAGLDAGVYAIDSWETFQTYAQRLTRHSSTGDVIRAGYSASIGMLPFQNWLYANGGNFYNEDFTGLEVASDAGFEALEFLVNLQMLGQVLPPGTGYPLASGRTAIYLGGTWDNHHLHNEAPDLRFRITSLPPGPRSTQRAVTGWVNMMAIPRGAKNPDLAWEYLKYYTGLQGQIDILQVHRRASAPRYDLYSTPEWAEAVAQYPYLETLPEIYQAARPYPFVKYADLSSIFSPLLSQVTSGQLAPKQALEEAQRRGNIVLREN